ncbi:MAG TPA: hypothetical protein VNO81_03760 [Candidatus Nitrosotenuis sp.]|jgi:hypothetical protein|nr:hypothetical protein [Candidatus Nitrosotenuis sp.]
MGIGVGSVDGALEKLISSARRELIILAFRLGSGTERLLHLVRGRLAEGVQLVLAVEHVVQQPAKAVQYLRQLSRDYLGLCHTISTSFLIRGVTPTCTPRS